MESKWVYICLSLTIVAFLLGLNLGEQIKVKEAHKIQTIVVVDDPQCNYNEHYRYPETKQKKL